MPARGTKGYIGPDVALRRIAENVKAHAKGDLRSNVQGEPVVEAVTPAVTGDASDDADRNDPIHLLTVYPDGTFDQGQ
jgi:hypothetical protein